MVFPYFANYFREIPILLVLSPQKQFSSSLSLALRGWKNTDMLGKPVSASNGLKHVSIQLNFLLQCLATEWAGLSGHLWVSFFSSCSGEFHSRWVSLWRRRCPPRVLSTLIRKYFFCQWIFADIIELCLKYVGICCNLLSKTLKITVVGWPKGACKLLMSESIPCFQWCNRSCSGRSWVEAEHPNSAFHLL